MSGVYNSGGPVARVVLVDPTTLNDTTPAGTGTGASSSQTQGPVPSGGANTSNPEKIAGVYNTTLPSPATGQVVDAQSDERGNLRVRQVLTLVAGTDGWANSGLGRALASVNGTSELIPQSANMVFNGTTWDRQRGTTDGAWSVPGLLPAGTDRSGTAATSSGTLAAANASRRGLNIQNIGANNIGVNEFGGTAAIGTAGTYTLAPGASMVIRTNRLVTVIAATGATAYSATEF